MIWSIAWKNVWRNKLRSLVVISAVMIGLMAGSFGIALMSGLAKQRTYSLIHNEISHIQIHHKKFADNYETKYNISNSDELVSYINSLENVEAVTKRMFIPGMANSTYSNSGVFVYGINPDKEKKVTEIHKFLKDSSSNYFEKEKRNQVLIGEELAKTIKLDRYLITDEVIKEMEEMNLSEEITDKLKTIVGEKFRNSKDYINKLRELLGKHKVEENEFFLKKTAIKFKERGSVVLTFLNKDCELSGGKFRIAGIYKTNSSQFDGMSVFVRDNDLSRLSGYDKNNSNEIAVLLKDRKFAKDIAKQIRQKYPELKVETWGELNPELIMLSDYLDIYNYIIISFILAALAFGIINTMLMAIMERTKEIGMLAAIGMVRLRIFGMILLETVFLTITGALAGLLINFGLMSLLSKKGIDLSKGFGEGFEAMGYDSVIYPEMALKYYVGITLLVILTGILSSIYPAFKAIRLNPAEAVRTDA